MAPQFFKIILSPHASKLHIPDEFIKKYGTDLADLVVLEVPTGVTWEVKLQNSNGMAWLKEGWNQFKEYYSIGCGYFLLFQYNGNSHFSVFIFDLSASEIEYPPGPNEDMTPENFVNIVCDASNREKANGPEAKNNACDEILEDFPTGKTTEDNQVNACDEILDDLPTKKTAKDNQVNACDDILDDLPTKNTAKDNKVNSCDLPTNKTAKDKKVNACDEIMDDFRGNKTAKDDKVADDSYSRRNKPGVPTSFCLPERQDPNRVKLEKPDMEEDLYIAAQKEKKQDTDKVKLEKQNMEKNLYCAADKGKGNCSKVLDLSACKMTNSNQCNKRKYSVSLEASRCRYPLRSKKAKVVKLEKQDVQQNLYCEAYRFKGGCDGVTFAKKQLSTATSQVKRINLGEAQCSKLRNPYFIVSMQPTYVSRSFLLNIPLDFVKRYFKEESIVTLRVSDGRTWRVRCAFYSHCAKIHSPGWRDFVVDNNLKVHDTCDFELMEVIEPVLHVTIFRATPASKESPILQATRR